MAEWLRRVIRNHMGFPRGSSNLSGVVFENFVEAQVTVMCKVSMTSLQLFELFELFLELLFELFLCKQIDTVRTHHNCDEPT